MFYVSSVKDGFYGVTDTTDGVEDFHTKEELIHLVKNRNFEIDGVDVLDNAVCPVRPLLDTVRLFKEGKVHLAISTMSLSNDSIGLRFRSKPSKGEISFVSNAVFNISRRGVNCFSCDFGSSSSYRGGLTFDEIMTVLEQQFAHWRLSECKKGRF